MEPTHLKERMLLLKHLLCNSGVFGSVTFRGGNMRKPATAIFFAVLLVTSAIASSGQTPASKDARGSLAVVFKDGHSQSFSMADIVRIDFGTPAKIVFKDGHQQSLVLAETSRIEFNSSATGGPLIGKNHFLGKWKVGMGGGGDGHFLITLKADGEATKSVGSSHGTWTVVDGEARITWDDGWRDVIRRAGTGHEKVAHEPGTTFSDPSTNVADATRVDAEPI
jgi:hypothetical protein